MFRLLAHAEMGEDVVEGFLWSNLAAGYFGKDVKGLAEVFAKQVAAEAVVEAVNDAAQALAGTKKSLVVAGAGDYDVGV